MRCGVCQCQKSSLEEHLKPIPIDLDCRVPMSARPHRAVYRARWACVPSPRRAPLLGSALLLFISDRISCRSSPIDCILLASAAMVSFISLSCSPTPWPGASTALSLSALLAAGLAHRGDKASICCERSGPGALPARLSCSARRGPWRMMRNLRARATETRSLLASWYSHVSRS